MFYPVDHEKVHPSVEASDTRISSTTLVPNDTQMSKSTLVPESSQRGHSFGSPFFNLVPLVRGRPGSQTPRAATAAITHEDPIIQGGYEENYYSYDLPHENIPDETMDDEPMYDELQATADSNYFPTRLFTAYTEDEELSAKQASINVNNNGFQGDTPIEQNILSSQQTGTIKGSRINSSNIAATQRAMLERKLGGAKQLKSVIGTTSYQAEAESTTSFHLEHDDHSWMNEAPESDEEYENLVGTVKMLERRHNNGKITNAEGVKLFRLKRELALKNKLRQAAASANKSDTEDKGLFVQEETREEAAQRHAIIAANEQKGESPALDAGHEDGDDSSAGIQLQRNAEEVNLGALLQQSFDAQGTGPAIIEKELTNTKKRRKPPKNAREFHAREEQARQDKERRKSQKKKARKPAKRSPQKSVAKAGKATKKGKGRMKANEEIDTLIRSVGSNRKDGIDEIGKMILEDLMSNDQIADRLNNPIFNIALEEQIYGSHKATQLQQLLANIPSGTDTTGAKNDQASLLKASKSFGYANVRAVDGKWLVKGMKSTLYHHQLIGAQWMLSRELSSQDPFGGLLADGMGLGKTVQMLACMLGNFPQEKDKKQKRKATLIVAPSSVINQWMDEIREHVEEAVFPLIYHYRSSSKVTKEMLEKVNIVVTSYATVMRQLPFPDEKNRDEIAKMGYKNWLKNAYAQLGVLHKVFWYRVILDEAHAIKNHVGRTSLACQKLKSVYRWCLTGTPLLNRAEELYPYLKFLGANYDMDWKTFKNYFCDPKNKDCYARIHALLKFTMLRRTMKTAILGRPIITLPIPHPEVRYIKFTPAERIIYRITESRFRSIINEYYAQGTAAANYSFMFVQLLRLRQCTSHPFMLEQTIKDCWTSHDVQELRQRLSALKNDHTPFYEQCKAWVTKSEYERRTEREARERGEFVADMPESMPFGRSDYGHSFKLDKVLGTLNEEQMNARVLCAICCDIPDQATITDCGHIFCLGCLNSHMHDEVAKDNFEYFVCPSCDLMFTEIKPYKGIHLDDEMDSPLLGEDEASQSQSSRRSKSNRGSKSKSGPGTDEMGFEPKTTGGSWLGMSDSDPNFKLVPSSKTTILKSMLLKSFSEAPNDKVVIYVQFRLLACIVGRICKNEGWKFLYLSGDCNLDHRSKAIQMFRINDDIKILIAGLRCGGLGLNFPWANRCISLDLWWNHAVEQQAFGRIFRIGQKKETYLTRLVIRNSVDMRLLGMQLYKLRNCGKAIDDADQERQTLGLADLTRLFGFLKTDEDNNIIGVEPDYDSEDDDEDDNPEGVDDPRTMSTGGGGDHIDGDWLFGGGKEGPEGANRHVTSGTGSEIKNEEAPSDYSSATLESGTGATLEDPMIIDP